MYIANVIGYQFINLKDGTYLPIIAIKDLVSDTVDFRTNELYGIRVGDKEQLLETFDKNVIDLYRNMTVEYSFNAYCENFGDYNFTKLYNIKHANLRKFKNIFNYGIERSVTVEELVDINIIIMSDNNIIKTSLQLKKELNLNNKVISIENPIASIKSIKNYFKGKLK